MRVNLTTYGPEPPDNNKTSRAAQSATPTPTADTTGTDQTRFSFDQARVQSLEAEVMAQPEIRGQKVGALQSLLAAGQYTVSNAQLAQAMMDELSGGNSGR